jgi:hypothetical protein
MVKGCLTPEGASPAIYHAKPVIIQGALIAANAQGDFEQFRPFLPQMEALDHYWETISKDAETGLFTWHDQLESGSDNLVTSQVPCAFPFPHPVFRPTAILCVPAMGGESYLVVNGVCACACAGICCRLHRIVCDRGQQH